MTASPVTRTEVTRLLLARLFIVRLLLVSPFIARLFIVRLLLVSPFIARLSIARLSIVCLFSLLSLMPPQPASAASVPFAATLDAMWDYRQPALSEERFRALLAKSKADSPEAQEIRTQIARTQGLRRQFDSAHATLDAIEPTLPAAGDHVRIRYLLERGRAFNSAGTPERAVPLFRDALAIGERTADDFYAVDAAHMLGIAAPPADRLDWNLRALAMAEKSADARARTRWRAPLFNNIGWTYHERGDFARALENFEAAVPAYEARGDPVDVRIARWAVARALRSLGKLDAAEKIQRALHAELDVLGTPDGYVYEELAEIAIARGDAAMAKPWAAKAHAILSADAQFASDEPARLARLAELGGVTPPPATTRSAPPK